MSTTPQSFDTPALPLRKRKIIFSWHFCELVSPFADMSARIRIFLTPVLTQLVITIFYFRSTIDHSNEQNFWNVRGHKHL